MKVDKELVKNIAATSRLNLSEKEVEKFVPELQEVISYFSKLDEAVTDNVKISLQPIEIRNVLRDDEPDECFSNEQALAQTKHKKDGYFKGPSAL
jgi:aspartyl-tRNA(Asn)/glutamyl-tRNA(Gln) amidotransferase subunit C